MDALTQQKQQLREQADRSRIALKDRFVGETVCLVRNGAKGKVVSIDEKCLLVSVKLETGVEANAYATCLPYMVEHIEIDPSENHDRSSCVCNLCRNYRQENGVPMEKI